METLNREGWLQLEPLLSESQISDIVTYWTRRHSCVMGNRFSQAQFPENLRWARYSHQAILACPHVVALMNESRVLKLAYAYLGCKPTISDVGIDWSFAVGVGL